MTQNNVNQSVNIRDEFHFSEVNGSMNVTGPVQKLTWGPSGVTYFARDSLLSYFHEPQKNEIYFLNALLSIHI